MATSLNASANNPAEPDIGGVGGRTTNGGDISGVGDAGGGGVAGLAPADNDGGGEGDVSGLLLLLLLEMDATTGEIGAAT